jgi:signal transduction histidine kinase/ActR/RegA family two-component response regulator
MPLPSPAPARSATSAPRDAAPAPDPYDAERLRVLVEYSTVLRFQMISAAAVIAAVAWLGGHTMPAVAAWFAGVVAVRELRAAWLVRIVRRAAEPVAPRLRTVTLLTFALGAAYGSSALFLPGMDTAFDAILTMIVLTLSAGAISTTFSVLPAFVAFGAALTLPCAAAWAAGGGWAGAGVAALMLMFLGVQVRFARQTLRMFEESYRMRQAHTDLLRELSDERARLAHARDAAVAADLAKSRFLAAASHDLRQPLQSLALNSGALSRMPMDAQCRQIAGEIGQGIEALGRMLDALLDISQLDAGAMAPHLQPVRLDRLLQGLAQRLRATAEAKGLAFELHCPENLTVVSDAQMLQRVVSNLLDNAVKFTAAGRIALHAEPAGARVRLTVADSGCGMDPAQVPRIFEDLVQLGNPQRNRAQGHGLGLGIVRRLCRLLGIEIDVETAPGQGTRMRLELPASDAASDAASAPAAEAAPPRPALVARRVLVLDDDAAVRFAYAHSLRSLGCEVTLAATLDEALAALAVARPEVALVDYRLAEGIDGLQAVARLRAAAPALPALIVSADTSQPLRASVERAGVPMLHKPVSDSLLAQAITQVLAGPGSEGAAGPTPPRGGNDGRT